MKNRSLPLFLLLALTVHFAPLTCFSAAFEDIGIGARGRGMGGAFSTVVDDATAMYWNPAQLSTVKKKEFTAFYQDLYGLGLVNNSFFGYVHPKIGKGSVGFGMNRLGTSAAVNSMNYAENTFIFSYGRKLGSSLAVGATLKYYLVDYTTKASGIGFDLGTSYGLYRNRLKLGLALRNANNPQIRWETLAIDNLPPVLQGGMSYALAQGHVLALDANYTAGKKTHIAAGWESWFFKRGLGLRAGASETDGYLNYAFGVSLGYRTLRFDYSLERHYTLGYSSLMSLGVRL